jgi:ATP-dependent protease Clp ATPase subunit
LDAQSIEDLVRVLAEPKDSLIAQYRKVVRFDDADVMFTNAGVKVIAFCFTSNVDLYEGGFDPVVHFCAHCATQAVRQTTQPLSKEERLALVPSPKSVVAYLDLHVIGQEIAKRRIAVGMSNHF